MTTSNRSSRGALLAALVLGGPLPVLSGCGGASSNGSAATTTAAEETTVPTVEETAGYRVTVIDPGAAPRRPLRFDIPAGTEATAQMEMSQAMAMTIGDQAVPPQPPVQTVSVFHFGPMVRDGDRHETSWSMGDVDVVRSPEMPEALYDQIAATMASLGEMTGVVVFDGRGRIERSETSAGPGTPPVVRDMMASLERSFENIIIVFPEEPIGVGAAWEIEQRVDEPIAMTQTVRHRLVGIEDRDLVIETTVHQEAGPQQMATGDGGPTLDVEGMKGRGGGEMRVRLDRVVGVSEAQVAVTMRGSIDANGEAVPMVMQTDMGFRLEPAGE